MKRLDYMKPTDGESKRDEHNPLELLLDPIRSKIVFEAILEGETTAEKLVKSTGKSRSTISHHLKKLVESELLEVHMNPTGKVKYYRLSETVKNKGYTIDSEMIRNSSLERKSEIILELLQFQAVISQIFMNLFVDQLKLLETIRPFEAVEINKEGRISFELNEEMMRLPYLTSLIVAGEEQATFLRERLGKMMRDFEKEFDFPENMAEHFSSQKKYLFNVQLFRYLKLKEKK